MIFKPGLIHNVRGHRSYSLFSNGNIAIRLRFSKTILWTAYLEILDTDFDGSGMNSIFRIGKEIRGFTHMRDMPWTKSIFNKDYREKEKYLLRYAIKMIFGDKERETI